MSLSASPDRFEVADRLHSAAIHLLRHARKEEVRLRQGPARLSALSVLVFDGPLTLGQLAQAEQVKAPTMSRIVAALKRSGLARIEADANDARRIQISVTPKGERLLEQARQRRIQAVADSLASFGEEELATLRKAAALIEEAVRRPATE